MTTIDASLRDQWTAQDDGWAIELPDGWMQGRSLFGGLTVATMAALARKQVPEADRSLRMVSSQLLAPVTPGPTQGRVHVLRAGRNLSFLEVQLLQAGALVARASLVFSKPMSQLLDVSAPPVPETPDPETLERIPRTRALPQFTEHVDMRWAHGPRPFSAGEEAAFVARFRYTTPVADTEGLLALLDTFPAPSLCLAPRPLPASTVGWTAHLLTLPDSFAGWFTMQYATLVGAHGMHTVAGWLYGPDGTPLAWSEQLYAVFTTKLEAPAKAPTEPAKAPTEPADP